MSSYEILSTEDHLKRIPDTPYDASVRLAEFVTQGLIPAKPVIEGDPLPTDPADITPYTD